ncbi:type II toxin-antitoxin system HicA family toxin [Anaerolineales bacterium HSG6]|nr:type II toxin-antitoxin system HicA family toxin [Anaerolineales bacterium HSG6]MDM8530680.1 type II toxin-antitoxin system HicA family toxin [Anaerolineales bacterium HSG25]
MSTIKARVMIKFLESLGFALVRQRGSHKFFRHPDGRTATVPDHRGEDLGRGITNKILRDVEVTQDDFMDWHRKK